jgi:hypothetical protein
MMNRHAEWPARIPSLSVMPVSEVQVDIATTFLSIASRAEE